MVEAWTARAEATPLISACAGLRQDLRSPRGEIALARGGFMNRVHLWVLWRQGYWERELGLLRGRLEAEIDGTARTTS